MKRQILQDPLSQMGVSIKISTRANSWLPKLFFGVVGGLFAILGLVIAGVGAYQMVECLKEHANPKSPCRIVESGFEESDNPAASEAPVRFWVRFEYDSEGVKRESRILRTDYQFSTDYRDIFLWMEKYPAGAAAECHVDRNDPALAYLEPRGFSTIWLVLFGLMFAGMSGTILSFVFGRRSSATTGLPTRVLLLFGVMFTIMGGLTLWASLLRPAWQFWRTAAWVEVPCRIESSHLHRARGSKGGAVYEARFTYTYEFQGRRYISNRVKPGITSSSGADSKKELLRRFPVGSSAICRVNPKQPCDALLVRELSWEMLFGILGIIFLFIGLGCLWSLIKLLNQVLLKAPGQTTVPS